MQGHKVLILLHVFMITVAAVSCIPEICNHTLYIYGGELLSPNYPEQYLSCTQCSWSIRTLPLHKIKLVFQHFDLEDEQNCKYDNVSITNYLDGVASTPEYFCGKSAPPPIISSENMLMFTFMSDQRVEKTGFKAIMSSVLCGGNIRRDNGTISTPFYPDNYLGDKECMWTISVEEGFQVILKFQLLMKSTGNCTAEYLEIRDGQRLQDDLLLRLCGNSSIKEIRTSANEVLLRYVNKVPVQSLGATISFNKTTCGGILHQSEGLVKAPRFGKNDIDAECTWTIIVDKGYQVAISFQTFELPYSVNCSESYLHIYDGSSVTNTLLKSLCDDDMPDDIYSTGNAVTIHYFFNSSDEPSTFLLKFSKVYCTTFLKGPGIIQLPTNVDGKSPINCSWVLIGSNGRSPAIQFEKFQVFRYDNCVDNFLEIYEERNEERRLLGRHCSQTIPSKVQSSTNRMFVRIFSKNPVENPSFSANVSEATNCGGTLYEKGNISSPNYPFRYADGTNCTWILEVKDDHPVVLNVEFLKLISPDHCVEIYDVIGGKDYPLRRLCGNAVIPSTSSIFYSTVRKVKVVFKAASESSVDKNMISTMFEKKIGFSVSFYEGNYSSYKIDQGISQISAHIAGRVKIEGRQSYVNIAKETELIGQLNRKIRIVLVNFAYNRYNSELHKLEIFARTQTGLNIKQTYSGLVTLPHVFTSTGQTLVLKYTVPSYNSIGATFTLYYSQIYEW